jgi:ATP-dependent Lhr-like helicase
VVTREVTTVEDVPGGFSKLYSVLRRMEETGRVRRGYFVAGLGAAQFSQPGAIDRLRGAREVADTPQVRTLAATDPANPYGAMLPWPAWSITSARTPTQPTAPLRAQRSAGARVVLVDGRLIAWIGRGDRVLLVALPEDDADRVRAGQALAGELVALAARAPEGARGWLIEEINGRPAAADPVAPFFIDAGFAPTAMGLQLRVGGARRAGGTGPAGQSVSQPHAEPG